MQILDLFWQIYLIGWQPDAPWWVTVWTVLLTVMPILIAAVIYDSLRFRYRWGLFPWRNTHFDTSR